MKDIKITRTAISALIILLIPLVAMRFTSEVNWTLSDFIVMGILLFVTGIALEVATKKLDKKYRVITAIAIVVAFLLIWAHLAVGIVDSWPFAGS